MRPLLFFFGVMLGIATVGLTVAMLGCAPYLTDKQLNDLMKDVVK